MKGSSLDVGTDSRGTHTHTDNPAILRRTRPVVHTSGYGTARGESESK